MHGHMQIFACKTQKIAVWIIISMRQDVALPWNDTWHLFVTCHYMRRGCGSSHIMDNPGSMRISDCMSHNRSDVRMVQTNYNFTHALYHTRDAHMFQRGEKNNRACTFKFTRLCKTTRDCYIDRFHTCALVLLACKSRLVADHRYLLSGMALIIYEVTQVKVPDWWVACVWLYLRLSFIYEICVYYYSFDIKLMWFLASFWLRLAH